MVDDNETNRRVMASLLEKWGCRHAQAPNGKSALALPAALRLDFVRCPLGHLCTNVTDTVHALLDKFFVFPAIADNNIDQAQHKGCV